MCYMCLELEQKFNRAIQRAGQSETDWLSKVFEKRVWFLNSDSKDRCIISKFFYSTDEIFEDSDVLDGKRWDEALDIKFKDVEKALYPEYDSHKQEEFNLSGEKPTIITETNVKPICIHDWMVYEGLGTRKPEEICKKCGSSKLAS
jgi:hypothetical protein